jgi:hypothetical protein
MTDEEMYTKIFELSKEKINLSDRLAEIRYILTKIGCRGVATDINSELQKIWDLTNRKESAKQ